jgi:arylsulfatase A-like enzyme
VPSMRRGNVPTVEDKGTYATELCRREALRFIRNHRDRPFFCYVPFNAPHDASNLDRPRPGVQAPLDYIRKHYGDYDPARADTREARRKRYMAAVTYMDEAIGDLLNLLEELGLAQNTLVIFLSDNGGSGSGDNAPLRGGKSQMFEGGLRVPCIVRWPGVIPAGQVCDAFLTTLEVFPTLCAAAGIDSPKDVVLDGFDLTPILAGRQKSPREEMFWERRGDKAARVGSWKWVESERSAGLFDLATDLAEKHDLSKKRPDTLAHLKSRFAAWKKHMDESEPRGPFRDF